MRQYNQQINKLATSKCNNKNSYSKPYGSRDDTIYPRGLLAYHQPTSCRHPCGESNLDDLHTNWYSKPNPQQRYHKHIIERHFNKSLFQ